MESSKSSKRSAGATALLNMNLPGSSEHRASVSGNQQFFLEGQY